MSVKRFEPGWCGFCDPHPVGMDEVADGEWVAATDYANLEATLREEIARLAERNISAYERGAAMEAERIMESADAAMDWLYEQVKEYRDCMGSGAFLGISKSIQEARKVIARKD